MSATDPNAGKVPVTMLSGFLGAGKTTLLRYLLENSKLKIGCVVNDVASINIDAKLVRNDKNRSKAAPDQPSTTKDLADTVELQNGCACCNMQDELFGSFEQLLALSDKRGEPYTRIVLENSGVAEPGNIRDNFRSALEAGHPLMDRIYLDSLVTVVDGSTFTKDFATRQPLAARPDLGDGGNLRPVVDLLVEQVECADFVIVNKTDLLEQLHTPTASPNGPATALEELVAIVSSLNPLATVVPCTHGKVPLEQVFGAGSQAVVARLNIEGQHRGAVAAARTLEAAEGHGHKHAEGELHGHHHHHKHDHKHTEESQTEGCTHEAHHHHHHHDDAHQHDGKEASCDDPSHKHEHTHDHDCKDAGCTDPHHHHHHHEKPATTAALRFGIKSFVYTRRRPFHPQRLKEMVLKWLPVAKNTAIEGEAPAEGDSPIKTVLRSKGFMWMSNSHSTAYYWSHAGQHFEIRDEGDWWAAVPDEDWPPAGDSRDVILADWSLEGSWGDRRQEIVFIGVGMDQDKISAQLDAALLSDEEMDKYVSRWAAVPDPAHPSADVHVQAAKKAKLEHHHHHHHESAHKHEHGQHAH